MFVKERQYGDDVTDYCKDSNRTNEGQFTLFETTGHDGNTTTVLKVDGVGKQYTTRINTNTAYGGAPDSTRDPYFCGFTANKPVLMVVGFCVRDSRFGNDRAAVGA